MALQLVPHPLTSAIVVCVAAAALAPAAAGAPVLTSAHAGVRYRSPTSCDVEMTLAVEGASEVEHRLELPAGASVTLHGTAGATDLGRARDIGRTRSLVLAPATPGGSYTLRYHVEQAASRPGRCPLWLPTAPARGVGRDVRLTVQVPDGAVASGTMPTFTWQGATGSATVPHLPAFVIVPFAAAGDRRPWDVSRVMDAAALAALAVASLLWMRRTRAARR
jgi:hypothetical protein